MLVTLHFEIDNAQIEVAADVGLDTKGRLIARSCRNCANRVWVKNNIDALRDSGMSIQRILKNLMNSSNEDSQKNPLVGNESDDSEKINQVHDTGIDWGALLNAASSYIDTDIAPKLTKDDSDGYYNSALKNKLNTIYGRYNNCEELIKRIQNSLKDTEGDIKKYTENVLNGILTELQDIHADVNILKEDFLGLEDYIVNNSDDEEECEDENLEEYLDSMNEESSDSDKDSDSDEDQPGLHEELNSLQVSIEDNEEIDKPDPDKEQKIRIAKGITFGNQETLRYIKGVYYIHNFYEYETLMSVDEMNWVVCAEKNIPQEYKDFINQKYIIDIRTFISGFSHWITMADPINAETKLSVHIATTNKLLAKISEMVYDLSSKTLGYLQIRMSKPELISYIRGIIFNNPETNAYFKVLNTSYNDAQKLRNGEESNSPNMVFCSRYSGPHWKDDFVDLDALTHNVVNFIINDSNYTA